MKRWSISLALASIVAMSAWACGPFVVKPRDFVVYNLGQPIELGAVSAARDSASWQAWCRLAGQGVRPEHVKRVMSASAITSQNMSNLSSDNPFAEWLAQHRDALDCLALAKQCQLVREFMQDPWYYPKTANNELPLIEEIEESALRHRPDEMQGRYVLTAVRAMMTQRKYADCIHYWDSVQSLVTCQAVRDLIEPYVVGCRFRVGDYGVALRQFIRLGDERSAEYCAQVMGVDLLEYARENPLLPIYQSSLDYYLRYLDICMKYDSDEWYWFDFDDPNFTYLKCQNRRDLCLDVAAMHPANEAMWLYAAAALSDVLGQGKQAVNLCNRAIHAAGHRPLDDKLRVLKFYVQARTMPLGRAYDAMVQQGVRMLADLTERDLEQFEQVLTSEDNEPWLTDANRVHWIYCNEANYYWNNMLKRIVVGTVVPRLIQVGQTTQALLLCNMAENHLNHLMRADSLMQRYDNHTFTIADTLSTLAVKQYRELVAYPHGNYERWLVSRSYNRDDYWNELLGTKCLRDMDYRGAVAYLSQVGRDYQRSMNIWDYLCYDPMRFAVVSIEDPYDYKLHYAQAMLQAQQTLAAAHDADSRADAMMRLAVGLTNANRDIAACTEARCWPLLRYGTGEYTYEFGKSNELASLRQYRLIEAFKHQAYSTFVDHEKAARWAYEWADCRRVISHYPQTATAQFVGTHCDQLRDYYQWKIRTL